MNFTHGHRGSIVVAYQYEGSESAYGDPHRMPRDISEGVVKSRTRRTFAVAFIGREILIDLAELACEELRHGMWVQTSRWDHEISGGLSRPEVPSSVEQRVVFDVKSRVSFVRHKEE